MALSAPATLAAPPLDLPWTLTGGRGVFGLPPIQGALLVWGALMAFIILFVLLAALTSRWQWGRLNRADARAAAASQGTMTPAERARLRTETSELIRQAAATGAAARRALTTVEETRIRRDETQRARELAWEAFSAAQKAYELALREATGRGHDAQAGDGPGEAEAQQKRDTSRAALAAYRRGEITVDQLRLVFRQASGWDPLQELQAREVELRRSAESRARRLYQAAAAAERAAVKAADIAAVAAQALAEEAVEVTEEALEARRALDASRRATAPPVVRPRPVRASKIPRQRKGARIAPVQVGELDTVRIESVQVGEQATVRIERGQVGERDTARIERGQVGVR